jgi:predicted dehydrogenase
MIPETLRTLARSGRIGTPVFLRCLLTGPPDRAEQQAKTALADAAALFGEAPDAVLTRGTGASGHALARFPSGACALLLAAPGAPSLELMLLGNRGAAYLEDSGALATTFPGPVAPSPVDALASTPVAPSRPLGLLLLGGMRTHQENYAESLAADPRCRLVAVADEAGIEPEREALNRALAEELHLPYIADLDKALAYPGVDLVSVCVPHERRARVAVRCAEAGKHLYLDKPIACTVPGARAIAEAVERAGVRSQMFSMVHAGWAQTAKRVLETAKIGALKAIHAEVMFAKGLPGTAPLETPRRQEPFPARFTFRDSKRELRATGVYALSLIRWLTGLEVRSVFAHTANYFFAEHARNDTEDFGLMSLELERGVTATVTAGRIGRQSHPRSGPMRVTLVGTTGTVTIDAHRPHVAVYAEEAPWVPPEPLPEDPMGFWRSTMRAGEVRLESRLPVYGGNSALADAAHFLDCVERGHDPEVTARDGAALVETLMAAYVSAHRGEAVDPGQIDWPDDETLLR